MKHIKIGKKILAGVTTFAMVFASFNSFPKENPELKVTAAQSGGMYDYAVALDMSMFFYEAQQSGPLADWNRVTWRADAGMSDEVLGGWFDAGDHVKFNVPMAYSVATLCWGLYQWGDSLPADLKERVSLNCMYALDYLVACDRGDKVVVQVGADGMTDHKWWGSPEIVEYEMERTYQTTDSTIATGTMSAALAAGYAALKDDYPEQAAVYLDKAEHYFEIADTVRSDDDYMANVDAATGNFYKSWSPVWDELFFASNWLYLCTQDQKYMDLAESYIPNLQTENQSTELKYSWPYNWDDKLQGAIVLMAYNTGDEYWISRVQRHLEWMQAAPEVATGAGSNGSSLAYLGDQWGVTRYANNGGFMANLAADLLDLPDEDTLRNFAASQVNYVLGDNPAGWSYVVGYSEKDNPVPDVDWPMFIHHRAASGDWIDSGGVNNTFINENGYSHVLYGALVGGPDKSGSYKNVATAYEYTEVATDYNAAYSCNLMKLISEYGYDNDYKNFPPESISVPTRDEFYVEGGVVQDSQFFTGFSLRAYNHTAWPARVLQSPTIRYFFDISEVLEAGYTVDDMYTKIDYERYNGGNDASPLGSPVSPLQISEKPVQYDGNIYYVELSYPNSPSVFAPQGQEQHRLDIQFRFGVPEGSTPGSWDKTNDYSYDGLDGSDATTFNITDKICLYDGDTLIYGIEPDGTVPGGNDDDDKTTTTTTKATTTTTGGENNDYAIGDVDLDGAAGKMSDIVTLAKYLGGNLKLNRSALISANCDTSDNGVTAADITALINYFLGDVKSLPVS
ncbi:MAG: glycoside hydrolase family 9 protein [Oscillospiraceae bacterium]|jgi:hypothetical protein|nr:glycoside hydrolase family 9 protein [Oscillospiraceae bacterium]